MTVLDLHKRSAWASALPWSLLAIREWGRKYAVWCRSHVLSRLRTHGRSDWEPSSPDRQSTSRASGSATTV